MADKKTIVVLMVTAIILSGVAAYTAINSFYDIPITSSFNKADKTGVTMVVKPARNANVGMIVHSIEDEGELK